jgi:hypothetical protein
MFFVEHDVKAKYQCVQKGTALTIAIMLMVFSSYFLVQPYFFIRNGKPYIIEFPYVCIVFSLCYLLAKICSQPSE